jgi:hypothetical protein
MSGDGPSADTPRADTPRADGPLQVNGGDIEAALQRIAPYVHRTPVLRSRSLDARHGIELFFKAENLQRMGAFKFRGAINALLQLSPEAARRGVLAYSSGNHAQAVALAGRELGIPTVIVMPEDAPPVKLAATREYGAEVITYDRQHQSREALSAGIAKARAFEHLVEEEALLVFTGEVGDQVEIAEMILRNLADGGIGGRDQAKHLGHRLPRRADTAMGARHGDGPQAAVRKAFDLVERQDACTVALGGALGKLGGQLGGNLQCLRFAGDALGLAQAGTADGF